MATQLNSEQSFNELVFENRNKEYGAYAIRSGYQETITKSLLMTMGGIMLLVIVGAIFANTSVSLPKLDDANKAKIFDMGTIVDVPHPEKKIPEIVHPKEPTTAKSTSGALVASDKKEDKNIKTNIDMTISKNPNEKGVDSSSFKHEPEVPKLVETKVDPPIEKFVSEMPVLENMSRFISENLHYPTIASENYTKGTVYVSFVVELDGTVSHVEALTKIGDGCEEEAVRVVKLMKGWKPGINNNHPVRVQCNLPIKFSIK